MNEPFGVNIPQPKKIKTVLPLEESSVYSGINIRADDVERNDDGTFRLTFKTKPLSEDKHKLLMELFPNVTEQAYRLLNIEKLLASVVKE